MIFLTVTLPLLIAAAFAAGLVWDWRKSRGFSHDQPAGVWMWRIRAGVAIVVMLAIAGGGAWFNNLLPHL